MSKRGLAARLRAPADQGDHRLDPGGRARGGAEARHVPEGFDIQQNRLAARVASEFLEIIDHAQMHAVADGNDGAQRDVADMTGVDGFFDDGSRMGDHCHGSAPWHGAEEGGGEWRFRVEQIDHAGAVGPANDEPPRGGHFAQGSVACASAVTGFGETAGQNQNMPVAGIGSFGNRIEDAVGSHQYRNQVDRAFHRTE